MKKEQSHASEDFDAQIRALRTERAELDGRIADVKFKERAAGQEKRLGARFAERIADLEKRVNWIEGIRRHGSGNPPPGSDPE